MSESPHTAYLLVRDAAALAAATGAVAGMPLWLRTICGLQDAGVTRVVVVLPEGDAGWQPTADPRLTAEVAATAAPTPPAEGSALLLRGDVVYHRELLKAVARAARPDALIAATALVRPAHEGKITMPVALCAAPAPEVAGLLAEAGRTGLEAALEQREPAERVEVAGGFALPAGDRAAVRAAEKELVEALRKPIDGFMARHLNRHVSLFFTARLMYTGLTANHVSVFNMFLGVTAATLCAMGGYWFGAVAGIVLELQSILDGVDGELARLKYLRSRLGEWLDTLSDDFGTCLWLAGLTINLARGDAAWAPWVGCLGVAAMLAGQAGSYWLLLRVYQSGDLLAIKWDYDPRANAASGATQASGFVRFIYYMMKRDSFVTMFCVLALLGRLDVALLIGTGGAVGFLFKLIPFILRVRRAGLATRR
jgi:1L-myo-inositol 1-phosphate cytidylyltransferase / CDP-L-myo-inositol myo-inositolphosphotransferase